jgi:ankyrin repeat protein
MHRLDGHGSTPFCLASCHGQLDVVKFLLEKDYALNLELRNLDGQTALYQAACRGNLEVEFLVTNGANVDAVNNKGFSPLLGVLDWDRYETAVFLIEQGSDAECFRWILRSL